MLNKKRLLSPNNGKKITVVTSGTVTFSFTTEYRYVDGKGGYSYELGLGEFFTESGDFSVAEFYVNVGVSPVYLVTYGVDNPSMQVHSPDIAKGSLSDFTRTSYDSRTSRAVYTGGRSDWVGDLGMFGKDFTVYVETDDEPS